MTEKRSGGSKRSSRLVIASTSLTPDLDATAGEYPRCHLWDVVHPSVAGRPYWRRSHRAERVSAAGDLS